jgi:8-amino-7-oxononanoate synthase
LRLPRGCAELLIDARCHGSLLEALQCIGCPVGTFHHRDPLDLGKRIAKDRVSKTLVVTDGIFAFDGSVAPLSAYRAIAGGKPLLWVDDAHAAGVLGAQGRGSIEAAGISRRKVIQTITFSKAFGIYGGAILCDEHLRRAVVSRSSAVTGNTPLPLPLAAGILQSLRVLKRSHLKKLSANVQLFWETVGSEPENAASPIVAVANARGLSRTLLAADIYPTVIRYPGGPATGYFRFAISSAHTPEQVVRLAETIRRVGAKILSPLLS